MENIIFWCIITPITLYIGAITIIDMIKLGKELWKH